MITAPIKFKNTIFLFVSAFVPKQHAIWLPCSLTLAGHNKFRLQIPPNRPGICCITTDYTSRPSRPTSFTQLCSTSPSQGAGGRWGSSTASNATLCCQNVGQKAENIVLLLYPWQERSQRLSRAGGWGEGCAEQLYSRSLRKPLECQKTRMKLKTQRFINTTEIQKCSTSSVIRQSTKSEDKLQSRI